MLDLVVDREVPHPCCCRTNVGLMLESDGWHVDNENDHIFGEAVPRPEQRGIERSR